VLAHVAATVAAAHALGRPVEVCGEAAGEAAVAALLIGLGVDELSVSPTRLDAIRGAVRRVSVSAASAGAAEAVDAAGLEDALPIGSALLDESGDECGKLFDSLGGAVA
jgi:phosphoenolpyruvate-protein kinase (PTS system EI component)